MADEPPDHLIKPRKSGRCFFQDSFFYARGVFYEGHCFLDPFFKRGEFKLGERIPDGPICIGAMHHWAYRSSQIIDEAKQLRYFIGSMNRLDFPWLESNSDRLGVFFHDASCDLQIGQ